MTTKKETTKELYKICILDENGDINHIIVYDEHLKIDDETRYQNSFSVEEKQFINEKNIAYRYSDQFIHKDDTIKTIKNKIVHDLNYMYSYEEMYLFSKAKQTYSNSYIYDQYVGEQRILNNNEFTQLIVNYTNGENTQNKSKQYTKTDFLKLKLQDNVNIPLGRGFQKRIDAIFPVNPYDVMYDESLNFSLENQLLCFENHVLLHYKNALFSDNIIYVCLAENVLKYGEQNDLKEESLLMMYFPLLYDRNITSYNLFRQHKEEILKENKNKLTKNVFKHYEKIDLFYKVYYQRKNELDYVDKGIYSFYITIYPEFKYILPLDAIFKNIHSIKEIPFIKYNPGLRRENIYRFYSENITKYGEKIPFLQKNIIIKLSKDIGKSNQISFYVVNEKGDIYIDLERNGNINVYGNLKKSSTIEELEIIIKSSLNGVLITINDFLQKSGYTLKMFENIYDENVVIIEAMYQIKFKLNEKLTIKQYENCLKSVFDIIEDDIQDGAILRYKRIDNYTEMNAQDIFISELIKKYNAHKTVIMEISKYYDINITSAEERYKKFMDEYEQLEGYFVNKRLDVANSPGLLCQLDVKGIENIFTANITITDSIDYSKILFIYIDSLLRISQEPKSTNVLKSEITNICLKNASKEEIVQLPNIINITRAPEPRNIKPYVFEDEPDDDEENEDIMYTMNDFEDDSDQEENEKGEPNIQDETHTQIIDKKQSEFGDLDDYTDAFLTEADFEVLKEAPDKLPTSNLMFSEEFEEFEDDEDEDNEQTGGTKEEDLKEEDLQEEDLQEEKEINIDNMKLKQDNANIFLTKMRKLDPVLFSTTNEGKFKSYSSICQWSEVRQPIPLTNKEKEDIEKKYPGSINYSIKYGSDPKNKNWFVCPKYWCLKTNAPMSEEDIKSGKCGKEIPRNASRVPKGHYYYKFKDESVPGFITGKHSKGHCLPCCFKRDWDSSYMVERRKECESSTKVSKSLKKTKSDTAYIISVDTYPIEEHRKGFLPMSVQLFLQTDNSKSVKKENSAILKDKTQVFLRYGVEQTSNKSFVGCIADIYSTLHGKNNVYTINEMCKEISQIINIDIFLKLHNGSFFSIFKPKTYNEDDIDISKYEDSEFIKSMQKRFFQKININHGDVNNNDIVLETIAAYENFINFLLDENSHIDYTFLWDIVCIPNPKLFPNGLNLAILKIVENDMRDNIELICPTSTYSSVYYDNKKPTFIIIKHDEFFEPVYMFDTQTKQSQDVIRKLFYESQGINNITKALKIIRNSIKQYCTPFSSLPRTYEFKQNIDAESLKIEVLRMKYTVLNQIINYQRKTIGLFVSLTHKSNKVNIYLPCTPSALLSDYEMIFMDDPQLYTDYLNTREILQHISKESKKRILCNPVIKVIEDLLIVGVITETNQFIMLDEPSENIYKDELKIIKGENYILADKELTINKNEDSERIKTIQKISLETQFYEVFRYICKMLLNEHDNYKIKQNIQNIIENPKVLYFNKLSEIQKDIHKLCDPYVKFIDYDEMVLMSLTELSDCKGNNDKKYCMVENGKRKLLIPKKHLLSDALNDKLYFQRLSDEILRYKRIQSFMLDPKSYINIINNQYTLNKHEMIFIDSLINSEYFSKLKPFKYTQDANISYDIAHPIKTQKYSNLLTNSQQVPDETEIETNDVMEIECIDEKRAIIGNENSYWRKVFPKKLKEFILNKTHTCTYFIIIFIFKQIYKTDISIENLKTSLKTIYNEYMDNDSSKSKIFSILREQGKKKQIDSVITKKMNFDDLIMSETYNLSGLDIWLLSHHLKLPIILFTSLGFKTLIPGIKWLNLCSDYGNKPIPTEYYFIRYYTEKIQGNSNFLSEFTLLETPLELKDLGENFEEDFRKSSQNKISIKEFLK